ncbi:hypothetical protein A2303_02965 [Candidatus Falkowbacteria bacterium RIFOXYB2_FULL_47_14]|uniref:Endolytic murein transglycosylase n=1 Tax=Candidatus Falkowbacteria bacterium RIFOXYA2_FULL_47_19 TaxID=1797994 RepID=A0A1F5SMD2_9BACT|nr:MAG: hypothetical protein A2227_02040 [Candidatus Falkowbacteria bacterium RIFOXYA2_FULL_47_19]OGF36276.1 MAG: hypothetical protein A2468_07710 [Candidatus Falkowbacteria bacterium RIFOXYC2_FULL_46_15]OGF43080.1 MAG: hypothetical protein A2303_02965 [Candidatus Falkowbacteria bacterium RIFOXYB2_FULL_47_14]
MLKIFKYIAIFLAIGAIFCVAAYNQGINAVDDFGKDMVFVVGSGEGVDRIGQNLIEAGLIRSKLCFKIYIRRSGLQSVLQAGEYALNSSMSVKEIAAILSSGKSLNREREIKIIEGWNIDDIDRYLAENGVISKDAFAGLSKKEIGNWTFDFARPDFLKNAPDDARLEGYLFPDTYRIYRDAEAEDIIERMLLNFDAKLTPAARADIALKGKTIHDIIILASIVEKEVRGLEDKKIVAGILYKRLESGMKLEVDATINYITGKDNPSSAAEDLRIDSPYNTYKYQGLPPGPISNPGLDSILAAIYPEKSPYLFYLNRQDTGETIFGRNYEEHLRNKAKYLK